MTNALFKYFSTDEFHLEKFINQQVLLSPPKYFNDPWDFLVRREPQSEEELKARFENHEREYGRNFETGPHLIVPTSYRQQEEKERFQRYREGVTSGEFRAKEGSYMQDRLSAEFGVVCLTAKPLDRLMWAHYAASYRGFVAEFKCHEEPEWQGRPARKTPFGPAIKVVYADTWPQANKDFKNVWQVCSTKHRQWEDEEEWRVILPLHWQIQGPPRVLQEPRNGNQYYLLKFEPHDLVRVFWFEQRVSPAIKAGLHRMLARDEFASVQKAIVKIDSASGELVTQPFA